MNPNNSHYRLLATTKQEGVSMKGQMLGIVGQPRHAHRSLNSREITPADNNQADTHLSLVFHFLRSAKAVA